ncbi:DUF4173 domain-containing protein [Intrasporangium calvum]|uniref:histidine kinase n=1 Tax=Intrasporangium calvum TaxID=53358 RepID=A0ABT5GI46_9MICO|nr:DUF4153 domain-containing protein [Intrasporangium calvum]MDC5697933.1 DUF4173 domain-containing protein [Intrasporangium calvum]
MSRERPLDGLGSIKVKLAVLVGLSIVAASLVSEAGDRAGVSVWLTVPVTIAGALLVVLWLARGMTSPLREMTAAAKAMATGDRSQRVTATSADEVGELARAFNTMAADLAAADQQRRQLIAMVSHELRTPLTAQRALLENLVDGVVSPDDAALRTALRQSERLSDLVADLLDLSRVDGGLRSLSIQPVDVAAIIAQGVAEARAAGGDQREIAFDASIDEPLPVEADPDRLAQVVANLLDNAVRHSPVGGTVRVRAARLGEDRWTLEVGDDGPGIDPEHADRVFDRFGSWQESGGGTGLGLAIASWVCELHGGSITVVPPQGETRGAHVRATLPRHPATPGPVSRSTAQAVPATPPAKEPLMPSPQRPATTIVPTPAPGVPAPAVVDSVFGDLWPERGLGPRPGLVLGSVGIGAMAALVLPDRRIGLGFLGILLLAAALVLRGAVRLRAPWTLVSAGVGVGLASLAVLRAAEWITVLAVLVCGLLLMTALTGALSFVSMLGGWASWVLAAVRGLPLLGRTLTAMSSVSTLWPVVRTVSISVAALVIFGGLFASGDAVFGSWTAALVPDVAVDSVVQRFFIAFVVGGTVLAASYVAINPPRVDRLALPQARSVARSWEWLVPATFVIAVFVAFVVAQAAAMWGGHDYVQRTTGLTYAEYVHQGFGQLTAVTFLTLLTVALGARKAPRGTAREQLLLRLVLGTLCLLALVVVASALYRMSVYQEAYGFTVLRVLVDAFELWMGLLLLLVIVAGVRLSGWWLPRVALLSGAVLVLAIGLANPEAWVAQRNIDRYEETGRLDAVYLASLGPDAAPTIRSGLPPRLAACLTHDWRGSTDDWLSWNLGRARASDGVAALTAADQPACNTLIVSSSTGG